MPIIPMPIFIPDDGNNEILIPSAVEVILFGGIITTLIGLVALLSTVVIECVFDKDADVLIKIAGILTIVGIVAVIIGLVLVLITGETVEG